MGGIDLTGGPELKEIASGAAGQRTLTKAVLKWTDADTALLYAAADKASLLFTLKFDAEGNSKIVKVQPVSEKELDELND
jgi:hypothetical protein